MYTDETLTRVIALHDDGRSTREIARMLGVSRGFVCQVLSGRRQPRAVRCANRTRITPSGVIAGAAPCRCKTCGYLVVMPCRICAVRARRKRMATQFTKRLSPDTQPVTCTVSPFIRNNHMSHCDVCEDREASVYTVRLGMNLFVCNYCEELFSDSERRLVEAIRFNHNLGPLGSIGTSVGRNENEVSQ